MASSRKPIRAPELVAAAIAAISKAPHEVIHLAEQALAAAGLTRTLRCEALRAQGVAHIHLGQLAQALAVLQSARHEAHELKDATREARVLNNLGIVHLQQGELEAALKALAGAISLAGPGTEVATGACANIGLIAEQVAENQLYLEFEQAALAGLSPGPARLATAINCASALCKLGRPEEGRPYLQQVLAQCDPAQPTVYELDAASMLAWIDAHRGAFHLARTQLTEVIDSARAAGLRASEVKARMLLAEVQMLQGQTRQAVATAEASLSDLQAAGHTLQVEAAEWLSRGYASLQRWEDAYRTLRLAQPRSRSTAAMHESFLLARKFINRGGAHGPGPATDKPPHGQTMSAMARKLALSQADVALLEAVARGLGNRAIAEDLGLSVHTVRNRLARVMRKLGVHSRAAATAQALDLGLVGTGS